MKLFVVYALVACVAAGPSLRLECTYGPSFWCSSLATAKQCGAVDHCISTVWAHQKVEKANNDAVCDFCQGVISQVKALLLSNETEGQIHDYFTKACSMIPDTYLSDKCKETVDHYQAEIIKMIQAQLDPVAICEAIGMCKTGFMDSVDHSDKLVKLPLKFGNATECADCKKFIADVKARITDKSTKEQIISMIEQNVCSQLGSLEPECKTLVENYADAIVDMISSEVDPAQICQAMGFCGGNRQVLMSLQLSKSKLFKAAHKVSDDIVCDVCKEAMGAAQNLIKNNKTQQEIEQFLDDELCDKLGSLSAACKDGVKEFGPVIFELLANELDPETVCKAIGLCPAALRKSMPAFNMRPAVVQLLPKKSEVKNTIGCVLCELVLQELDSMLSSNATEQEIIKAVDQVCAQLPASVSDVCKQLVDSYGPAIISALVGQLDPKTVCPAIGLCKQSTTVQESSAVKDGPLCALCEYVMQTLDDKLDANATKQEIISAVDQICNQLPATIATECQSLINQYGGQIIDALVAQLNPKAVCTFIGLCTQTETLKAAYQQPNVQAPPQCVLCEFVLRELESKYLTNATEQEIISAVEKVCSALPKTVSASCKQLVDQYGPTIIGALIGQLKPDKVCTAIGLCTTKQIVSMKLPKETLCQYCDLVIKFADTQLSNNATRDEVIKTIEMVCNVVPSDMKQQCDSFIEQYGNQLIDKFLTLSPDQVCQALGLCPSSAMDKCKLGPTYWCASFTNAKKCNAVNHCHKHVW